MTTQLKGHGLLREGRPLSYLLADDVQARPFMIDTAGPGFGICSCGERSPWLPSNAARRRWHNEHKDSLR